jgi:hypothetical protein
MQFSFNVCLKFLKRSWIIYSKIYTSLSSPSSVREAAQNWGWRKFNLKNSVEVNLQINTTLIWIWTEKFAKFYFEGRLKGRLFLWILKSTQYWWTVKMFQIKKNGCHSMQPQVYNCGSLVYFLCRACAFCLGLHSFFSSKFSFHAWNLKLILCGKCPWLSDHMHNTSF